MSHRSTVIAQAKAVLDGQLATFGHFEIHAFSLADEPRHAKLQAVRTGPGVEACKQDSMHGQKVRVQDRATPFAQQGQGIFEIGQEEGVFLNLDFVEVLEPFNVAEITRLLAIPERIEHA